MKKSVSYRFVICPEGIDELALYAKAERLKPEFNLHANFHSYTQEYVKS